MEVSAGPRRPAPSSALAANATLSLLNVCCYLIDRQLATQAAMFEREGGFTERLYRVRSAQREQVRKDARPEMPARRRGGRRRR